MPIRSSHYQPPRAFDPWQLPGAAYVPWYVRPATPATQTPTPGIIDTSETPQASTWGSPAEYWQALLRARSQPMSIPVAMHGMGQIGVATAVDIARRYVAIGVPVRQAARYAARALWRLLVSA